jgi:hypothetical protein
MDVAERVRSANVIDALRTMPDHRVPCTIGAASKRQHSIAAHGAGQAVCTGIFLLSLGRLLDIRMTMTR